MTYTTRKTLRTLLPIIILLSAIGVLVGLIVTRILQVEYLIKGCVGSLFSFLSYTICLRVDRHKGNAAEEAFLAAFLIAIGSYAFPAILFFQVVLWGILIYRQAFDGRTFMASILGYAAVAIIAFALLRLGWIDNPWLTIFSSHELMAGIVVGVFWGAWVLITIVRQTLHER